MTLSSLLGKQKTDKLKLGQPPEFDITGNAHKRITPLTPSPEHPKPAFTDREQDNDDDEETIAFRQARAHARSLGKPLQEETDNILKVSAADKENPQFMSGVTIAVKDKAQNKKRNLDGLPEDFIRGYKSVKRSSWWTKANDRLTQWAADLGNSYKNRA